MTPLPPPERVAAVVVAAGRGERLGAPEKVLIPLAGRAMLAWSLDALEHAETIAPVVVVAGSHTLEAVRQLVRDEGFAKVQAIVGGGERRQDSVGAGLAALPDGIEIVVIHDGAGLWAAQTPQAFQLETLRRALAASSGETVTDEARLCEAAGVSVSVVPASSANLKVTHAEDIPVADALLRARHGESSLGADTDRGVILSASEESRLSDGAPTPATRSLVPQDDTTSGGPAPVRTGIGYDAHRFASGRRLVLGGVEIAHDRGLDGHSDADVLLHAIADAVLGAAALGDIGEHFPPCDERFHNADSLRLLREVVRLARETGWAPGNVDATVLAEAPRVAPYVPLMRERIAGCLGLSQDAVSVKATTNEGMGSIGRGEGIAALATVTLVLAVT